MNEVGRWVQWVPGAYPQPRDCRFELTHSLRVSSNDLRVCPIRDGGVQNHSFLFRDSEGKRAAVAHRRFVAWEYCVFLLVSFLDHPRATCM